MRFFKNRLVIVLCSILAITYANTTQQEASAQKTLDAYETFTGKNNKQAKLFGIDYLGGAKYKQLILDEHPSGWAAGFFVEDDLFGSPKDVIQELARSGRAPAIRINLAWKDDHVFTEADFAKIVFYAKRFSRFPKKYRNVTWYFSGATEHLLDARLSKKLADQVLAVLPKTTNCFYVNNPWEGRGAFVYGDRIINEVHGSSARAPKGRFIFSYDGNNAVDDDIMKTKNKMKKAEIFFLWHPAMNGRLKVDDDTPRPQRRSWPTPQLIESLIYLQSDSGKGITIPQGWIWKSHADRNKTPPEDRAYKPVLLAPIKADTIELVTKDGRVIARSGKPLQFVDGRWRYYFSEYGYKLTQRSMRLQKDQVCLIRINGKIYGKINPAFRAGSFRIKFY